MDYHSFQTVKLSFTAQIVYCRLYLEAQSLANRQSDWVTILTENAECWVNVGKLINLLCYICDVYLLVMLKVNRLTYYE